MLKKFAKFILGLAIFSLIGGCAVGSDYVKPTPQQVNLPAEWHAKLPHNGSDLQLIDWWGQFKDPTLSYLIESALQTNPSIFQAIAKIKQAQANLQGSRSFLFPSVTGIGSAEVDKNTIVSTNTTGGTGDVFSNNGMTNGYSAGVNMSWEIDLFGANRRAIEASEARYAASQQNWNDAKVSLAAQVADVYVSIRQCQNLLLTYQEENKSRLATQNITELRVNAGFSPRTDGNQASGSLYQNSSTLAQQRGVCEKYANQLVALSGVSHTQLEAKLSESFGYIPLPKEVSINALPAEIINQRPDVAAAERNLAAANANLSLQQLKLSYTKVISPDDGVISSRTATAGSIVQSGSELFRLIRHNKLEWQAEVGLDELNQIESGQVVAIQVNSNAVINGRVRQISPVLNLNSKSGIVYIDIPAESSLKIGMSVTGSIYAGSSVGLVIPFKAVVSSDGYNYVMQYSKIGRVHKVKVELGQINAKMVEVKAGLKPTDRIVVDGASFLNESDLVTLAKVK